MKSKKSSAYIFALCSPAKKFPNIRDWYLKVIEEDIHQIAEFYDSLMSALDIRYGQNRHFFDPETKKPVTDLHQIFHPSILGSHWLAHSIEYINKYGVVYIANNGAMFPPIPDTYIEHAAQSSPDIVFPSTIPDEYVTIMQWAGGSHFYLESSINRVFPKPKYNTIEEAINDALLCVDRSKIRFR